MGLVGLFCPKSLPSLLLTDEREMKREKVIVLGVERDCGRRERRRRRGGLGVVFHALYSSWDWVLNLSCTNHISPPHLAGINNPSGSPLLPPSTHTLTCSLKPRRNTC
jgi:hypothetical protein